MQRSGQRLLALQPLVELPACALQYNGCKWMGGVLRVEPAKPHYRDRHHAEEAAELASQRWIDEEQKQRQQEAEKARGAAAALEETRALTQLKILRRDGKKVRLLLRPLPQFMFHMIGIICSCCIGACCTPDRFRHLNALQPPGISSH